MTASEPAVAASASPKSRAHLAEVAGLFLRLGFTAFGGPAAHIAMMRREVVERRKWMADAQFVDLLGVVNLIPGPSSTQLAILLGYTRAGWLGLVVGGICFIGPAMLIVLALAVVYVRFNALPEIGWALYGIKAVVVAIIAQALFGLGRSVLRGAWALVIFVAVATLFLVGINPLILLFGFGLVFAAGRLVARRRDPAASAPAPPSPAPSQTDSTTAPPANPAPAVPALAGRVVATPATVTASAASAVVPFSQLTLFLTFLKIGAVLYGTGYVLLAFLRTDFVLRLHWLTDRQLLDAISIGQFTPGPVFTTATFIGYLVGRWQGALVATLAIFLPSFVFVGVVRRLAGYLRRWPATAAILDGVNAAALGLIAAVLVQLGQAALVDVVTWLLALVCLVVLLRFKLNSAWLILGGALVGLLVRG
jgi:chromate transporter